MGLGRGRVYMGWEELAIVEQLWRAVCAWRCTAGCYGSDGCIALGQHRANRLEYTLQHSAATSPLLYVTGL